MYVLEEIRAKVIYTRFITEELILLGFLARGCAKVSVFSGGKYINCYVLTQQCIWFIVHDLFTVDADSVYCCPSVAITSLAGDMSFANINID
jgi:hypothetical protein